MRFYQIFGAVVVMTVMMAAGVLADEAQSGVPRHSETLQRIAFGGADPVSYFNTSVPADGKVEHRFEWQGQVYLFASAQNRDIFALDPGKYVPNFEGYCPYSLAQGELIAGDPDIYSIYEGKVYFFRDEAARSLWTKNPQSYQARAESAWQSRQRDQSPYEPKLVVPF